MVEAINTETLQRDSNASVLVGREIIKTTEVKSNDMTLHLILQDVDEYTFNIGKPLSCRFNYDEEGNLIELVVSTENVSYLFEPSS